MLLWRTTGDRSDLFTVHEWEDMMYSYLNSKKCTDDAEAYDLILGRLAGKARDIVKVSLRSAPGRTTTVPSSTIFDILKRNFSELMYSNMPMADFYNTLPKADESPMDYWIGLNKAIDVADGCLRRRNKCVEDPAAAAVMMFVSHCPDPSLAMSLQFKPAEQWSATEIQERLDCHRRNMKRDFARSPHYTPGSACHQNTVTVCEDPVPSSTKQPELSSGQSQYSDAQLNPNAAPFSPNTNVQHLVVEDVTIAQGVCRPLETTDSALPKPVPPIDPEQLLHEYELNDIDIDGCEVSESWKKELTNLIVSYRDVFSRGRLDCGEASDFVHRIHFCDDRPFRLPYRRIPPAHYKKLREALSEMEEKGIISKSISEYASPLVMVWKKDGSLRICTDFRWLNAKTKTLILCPIRRIAWLLLMLNQVLGHVISGSGISVDEDKVAIISAFQKKDLMKDDGFTPSQKKRPFILYTDASLDSLGAVLSQVPNGEDKARPIAFASKSLSRSQANYPAHRLEFLALKWSICDKFSHWLKGHEFTVWTDNNPLTYIMTKPKLDACEQRWVSKLAPYNFQIKYVPGRLNVVADALSRDPFVKPRFYWPGMERDVRDYVKTCTRCVLSKTPEPAARAPLESIKTFAPLELVCIDFWAAEDRHNKSVDVLVITDHFTKLAHAFPCRNQSAKSVAKKLWDGFFCIYGFPQHIHCDQGANFESELIAELLHLAGVDKSRTSPYHPMGNGGTERFNRTLGSMLRSLPPESKQKWPQLVQTMTFVYNCTTHETTGFAPFYLMFGRVPRLPVDLMFQSVLRDESTCNYHDYVQSLVGDLQSAMVLAQKNSTAEQKHQSDQYNKRVKGLPLSVGDQVLLANKGCRGKRKLADKWEPTMYSVVSSNPTLHIYKIRDRSGPTVARKSSPRWHKEETLRGTRLKREPILLWVAPNVHLKQIYNVAGYSDDDQKQTALPSQCSRPPTPTTVQSVLKSTPSTPELHGTTQGVDERPSQAAQKCEASRRGEGKEQWSLEPQEHV
ncbi:interleukin-1 receptor accessory protein-like 1-A isoform X1 [Silurus asotus]|uniref:Gypsy retrotransposon integrase-like protein 1 n=1 Tax=Silurus asotus TaxID=30991 RepID=A0AAD5AD59_SILAS|nr:interleukin-1 receptor accessory protein-like 1-A isoform X1 [Silurus asotus]